MEQTKTTRIAPPRPATPNPDSGEHPRNHNRPSRADDAVREFNDSLNQRENFIQRIDDLAGSAVRAEATDDDTAGKCTDLVRQIKAAARAVDDDRDVVGRPYMEAKRAVDDAAKRFATKLDTALQTVTGKLNKYLREKAEREEAERREEQRRRDAAIEESNRLAREEAARRDAEERRRRDAEEARIAAIEAGKAPEPVPETAPIYEPAKRSEDVYIPPPPKAAPVKAQVRSDYGGLASSRKQWNARVIDWPKAFKAVQTNPKVREAVQAALNSLARAGTREIAGCEVYADDKVVIR